MTDEQKAAYVQANAAAALIEAMGMVVANAQGKYREEHFQEVIVKYGIYHNALMSLFHG